ncbi:MAG: cyanophycinase [Blastocatellia bacterium]
MSDPKKLARLAFSSVLIFIVFSSACFAQQRLLVIGGGERPPDALKKFVEWSGGSKARILVVTWASGLPEESFDALKRDFAVFPAASIDHAAMRPLDAEKRAKFIEQMRNATGIFFSGGDQSRIMNVLADEELLKLIRDKYATGTPFGGTSAGAAAMSDPMMTGEADLKILDGGKVGVRKGLGLIPDIIFDQHFLVRQRHNRLFGFILVNPKMLGIGIDEDTAVLIEDNRRLEVAGKSQVMIIDGAWRRRALSTFILKASERFDLKKRQSQINNANLFK